MSEHVEPGGAPEAVEQEAFEHEARERLALSADADAAGRAAAQQYLWRYFLGFGGASALWLIVVAVTGQWSDGGSFGRAVIAGAGIGLLVSVALIPARALPVRAGVSRAVRIAMSAGGAVAFGLPAAVAVDYPLVAVLGAVVVFGYWAAWARWCTRG